MIFKKPKKCDMSSKGCGWIHSGKKLNKSYHFIMFRGDNAGILGKICNKISHFYFKRYWGFNFLNKLFNKKTCYLCDHHWLISNYGLVRTKTESGLQCFVDIKDLHIPNEKGVIYYQCNNCDQIETMVKEDDTCWSCEKGKYIEKIGKTNE